MSAMNKGVVAAAMFLLAGCSSDPQGPYNFRDEPPVLIATLPNTPVGAARCIQGKFEAIRGVYPRLLTQTIDTPPTTELGIVMNDRVGAVADLAPIAGGSSFKFYSGKTLLIPRGVIVDRLTGSIEACGGRVGP